jgi:hypothetical protein
LHLYFAKEHRFNSGKALKQPLLIMMGLFVSSQLMSAQNQWTTPLPIDTSRYCCPFGGEMALDDSDNIYVTFSAFETNKLFIVRSTDKGSTWMQYTYSGTELSRVPRDIVVDHNGNVWLLWVSVDDEFSPTYLNLSESTDSAKTFVTVFRSLDYSGSFLKQKLAVDAQNSIYMIWGDVRFKLTRFRHGQISQRVDADVPSDSFLVGSYPALAVSKDFVVHCAWEGALYDSAGYHNFVFYSRSSDTGRTFQGKVLVDSAEYPAIGVDSAGIIVMSYTRIKPISGGAPGSSHLLRRSDDSGRSFGSPVIISGPDTGYFSWTGLCIDSHGGVNILWNAPRGARHDRSTDGGQSFGQSVFVGYIGLLHVKAGKNGFLYATTANDSGTGFTKTNVVVSVSEDTFSPQTFGLLPNYPNPFNPSTTLQFSVGTFALVEVKIFDITGREVEVLLSRYLSPGTYSLIWNATHSTSGVYFVRLRAGERLVAIQKMLYVR